MAWWLAYEELYGNMDEEYPIMKKTEDESEVTSASDDLVTADLPTGNYYGAETVPFDWGAGKDSVYFTGDIEFRTDGYPGSMSAISSTIFDSGPDVIKFGDDFTPPTATGTGDFIYEVPFDGLIGVGNTALLDYGDPYDLDLSFKPQPNLKYKSQKYGEDKGIADLKDYVSSTYQGHYTNDNSDVQTLDLIHSVGDAESFCRSNALKYLSLYDKKVQEKRDILNAMHYCLLLYYFSGQTNETSTRGYETF